MPIINESEKIIDKINQFKQMMPSETSLEFILELCCLNNDRYWYGYHFFINNSKKFKNKMTINDNLIKSINLWCQNLLEAGYDSQEIRICALESEPMIFDLCKKIIAALKIKLPSKLEYCLLVIVLEVIYYNPNPRDYMWTHSAVSGAKYALEEIFDNEQADIQAHPLFKDVKEVHQQLLAIYDLYSEQYRKLRHALANYSLLEYDSFYLTYSKHELKNMITKEETDTFHINDKLIERLIQLVSGYSDMFTHPALRLM
jgi:hypothetical protein